jgi:hypothetical protein
VRGKRLPFQHIKNAVFGIIAEKNGIFIKKNKIN